MPSSSATGAAMRAPGPATPEGLAAFASELDAIRDRARAQVGEVDARYIVRLLWTIRGMEAAGRIGLLLAGLGLAMAGAFAMETEGICGPFAAPIEGMPDNWLALTDGTIAKNIKHDQEFRFYLRARLPERLEVIVDWGAVTGKLEVGKLVIAPGTKKTAVITEGYTDICQFTLTKG